MSTHKITGREPQLTTSQIQQRIDYLLVRTDLNEEPDDLYYAWPGTKNVEDYQEEEIEELRELIRIKTEELFFTPKEAWTGEDDIELIECDHIGEKAYQLAGELHQVDLSAWPFRYLEWGCAVEELLQDYAEVTLFGSTYYYNKV